MQFAKADYKINYNVVDVELGYDINLGFCSEARVFGGFKYASICQNLDILYVDNLNGELFSQSADKVKANVDMNAYGIYLGSEAGYTICDCFNLFGEFSYGALVGNFDRYFKHWGKENQSNAEFILDTNLKDDCWKFVSNINLTVGLEYELNNCFCADWTLAIGYEFHQWFCTQDFIKVIRFANTSEDPEAGIIQRTLEIDNNDNCLGFDDLFVRLGASF